MAAVRPAKFQFFDPGPLRDGELLAIVVAKNPGDPDKGLVPSYDIELHVDWVAECIGKINLRVGTTPLLEMCGGHIGYEINPFWRGRHYAERGVRLILPLAKLHGFSQLWITCNPTNWPSRRTCERLGAQFVEIVPVPPDNEMYRQGAREKCRYRLTI
jgi:tagatose 1,6-diphosphate aldolase